MSGYSDTVKRFEEIYRPAGRQEVLDAWERCNNDNLHVYVHTPFCASVCKFCYYKGVEFNKEKEGELYAKYFDDYLPRAIEPFSEVIDSRSVRNYFFGGGTPSLMSLDTMETLFQRLPSFPSAETKTFEVHPAVWSKEQIDLLAEYGFNCCIVGVQSYDPDVLKRQNRLAASPEKIHELVSYIRGKGMYVAGDLIYYMDRINPDEIFERDLRHAVDSDFDVLSLQLNYDLLSADHLTDKFFQMILSSPLAQTHYWENDDKKDLTVAFKRTLKCLRVVRKGIPIEDYREKIFRFVQTMDEGSKHAGNLGHYPSSIGFGSYRNSRKNTFSTIRDRKSLFEYIEVNDEWEPRYFVTYEWQEALFFEDTVRELDKLREIGPPPRGMKICFENKLTVKNENHIIREPGSQSNLSVVWDYRNPDIDAYIQKLKRLFPHWNWKKF
ncbi:MAG: hypothetical protein CMO55_28675 [Verrucomicrobiales bacterium]|nr:hypothetical protein [Verrucomicrobiales bacterium]